jgi:hypothetical protein
MALHDAVFILGAGASYPFGFPTGSDLRRDLCHKSMPLVSNEFSRGLLENFQLRFRLSTLPSIDRFLQNCQEAKETKLVEVGMAAIAEVLLPCEVDTEKSDYDWYGQLFDEVSRTPASDSGKVNVISFNYDRSFEHTFIQAFQRAFTKSVPDAVKMFNERFAIEHVYGQLGHLPELARNLNLHAVPYGGGSWVDIHSAVVIGRPTSAAEELHEKVKNARFIVFVGFGFLEENVDLLGLDKIKERKEIIATAYGLGDGRQFTLKRQFPQHRWFFGGANQGARDFFHEIDLFRQLRKLGQLSQFIAIRIGLIADEIR